MEFKSIETRADGGSSATRTGSGACDGDTVSRRTDDRVQPDDSGRPLCAGLRRRHLERGDCRRAAGCKGWLSRCHGNGCVWRPVRRAVAGRGGRHARGAAHGRRPDGDLFRHTWAGGACLLVSAGRIGIQPLRCQAPASRPAGTGEGAACVGNQPGDLGHGLRCSVRGHRHRAQGRWTGLLRHQPASQAVAVDAGTRGCRGDGGHGRHRPSRTG